MASGSSGKGGGGRGGRGSKIKNTTKARERVNQHFNSAGAGAQF